MPTTITVCDTCTRDDVTGQNQSVRHGEQLARLVEASAEGKQDVVVRRQSCLMGCERACNVAIQSPDKLQYVIGTFYPDQEAADGIVEYAQLHADSKSGQVPYKMWPQAVKGHFVARLPALTPTDEDA